MKAILLVPYYLRWHYGQALKGVFSITANIVWFFWHFFSIGILSETLFAPWERLREERKRGLDINDFLITLIINTVMRAVGAIVRLTFILIGLALIAVAFVSGILFFCAWLIFPAVIIFSIVFGFALLFKPS